MYYASSSPAPPRTGGPAMPSDFAEALFHSVRSDRNEPWGRQQAMDGLRAALARGRLNPYEHLAAQKRLQRDLEEQLQDLVAKEDQGGRNAMTRASAERRGIFSRSSWHGDRGASTRAPAAP